ncbi:MAG: hypothetical protein NC218_08045 [Acetobacter sp.]|nr:hypothetical protein [Acetobacter sp.]
MNIRTVNNRRQNISIFELKTFMRDHRGTYITGEVTEPNKSNGTAKKKDKLYLEVQGNYRAIKDLRTTIQTYRPKVEVRWYMPSKLLIKTKEVL